MITSDEYIIHMDTIYDMEDEIGCTCKKCIGEIDYDANVLRPMCGQCYDPTPHVKDQLSYRMKIPANWKIDQNNYRV